MQKGTLAWSTASQNLVSNWLNDYVINPTIEGDVTSSGRLHLRRASLTTIFCRVLSDQQPSARPVLRPLVTTSSPRSMDTAKYPGGAMGAVAQDKVPVIDILTVTKGFLSNHPIEQTH